MLATFERFVAGVSVVVLLGSPVAVQASSATWFFSDGSGNFGFNNGLNPPTIAFIESAQSSVDLAVFNLTDDDPSGNSIVDALIGRHVALGGGVRVIVDDNNAGHPAIDALIDAGVPVKFDTDTFDEMHNKFIVVDDVRVLTSTANFTEPGLSSQDNISLQIDDSVVAGAYTDEFNEMWGGVWKEASPASETVDFVVDGRPVRVLFGADDDPIGSVTDGLRSFVADATTSIHFGAYVWSDEVGDAWASLADDVVARRTAGVHVRGIFDRNFGANSPPYSNGDGPQMDALGMNVRLSQNNDLMHLKLMVVDQRVVAVGSANFTYSADAYNDENMVFYDDHRAARRVVQYLQWLHGQTVDEGTAESPPPDVTAPSPAADVVASPGAAAGSLEVTWASNADSDVYLAHVFVSGEPIGGDAIHWRTGPVEVARSVDASVGVATITSLSDGAPLAGAASVYVAVLFTDRSGNESALGPGSVAGPVSLNVTCQGPELCNGQDDDCDPQSPDGAEDPAVGVSCDGGDTDLCVEGVTVCVAGEVTCSDTSGDLLDLCNVSDDDCNPETADGSGDALVGVSCDGPDSDLCAEGQTACVAGQVVCSDTTGDQKDLCNGQDDDCNPQTADGADDPAVGVSCDGEDTDLCAEGVTVCLDGKVVCNDTTGDLSDVCNDQDDDCNPETADGSGDASVGVSCDGPDSDLCAEGQTVCVAGQVLCSDTTGDRKDLCNGQDDDCNPQTADGADDPAVGVSCDGEDTDLCAEGVTACVDGQVVCNDTTGDNSEVCNGQDDDCDPATPDGAGDVAVGVDCDGNDTDACTEGQTLCVDGTVMCGDTTGDTVELPDGLDNDCDGMTDEGFADPTPDAASIDVPVTDILNEVAEETGPEDVPDTAEPDTEPWISPADTWSGDAPHPPLDAEPSDVTESFDASSSDVASLDGASSDVASLDAGTTDGVPVGETLDGTSTADTSDDGAGAVDGAGQDDASDIVFGDGDVAEDAGEDTDASTSDASGIRHIQDSDPTNDSELVEGDTAAYGSPEQASGGSASSTSGGCAVAHRTTKRGAPLLWALVLAWVMLLGRRRVAPLRVNSKAP